MLRSEDYGFAKGEENTGAISEQMGSEAMPEISGNRELSDAEIQERSEEYAASGRICHLACSGSELQKLHCEIQPEHIWIHRL